MTLAERFFAKFTREGVGECWIWTGAVSSHGYGSIWGGRDVGNRVVTHVALELAGYPRPELSRHALHRCDTPLCVNPSHLWWGTHAENMADMKAKGRLDIRGFEKFWKSPGRDRMKTHCKRGHLLAGRNLYVSPQLRRQCVTCTKDRKLAARIVAKPIQEVLI